MSRLWSGGRVADHVSVMMDQVLAALNPVAGEVYVDATFGAGGYSRTVLEAADCKVVGVDRDAEAERRSAELTEEYGDRFVFLRGPFSQVERLLTGAGYKAVDGLMLDLGVSSMQLDQPDRGFSFRFDGPLDMRMDTDSDDETATDIVNNYGEKELADLIYHYGEERHSRRIARAIVEAREEGAIETTESLANIVRAAVPKSRDRIDPATRTFQALRIVVNRELEELEAALVAAEHILAEGGRLVVVSFHSLEDRIVKRFIKERTGQDRSVSRHAPMPDDTGPQPTFLSPSSKVIKPTEEEAAVNPRSRSAKLRYAVRTAAPPWPVKDTAYIKRREAR